MNLKLSRMVALTAIVSALILVSCEKEDAKTRIDINNLKGMFVSCEGYFSSSNGDISWNHPDSATSVTDLFFTANEFKAGSIVQSFAIVDSLGFMVVNNSQKVIVVNMRNFKLVKAIGGFSFPRNIVRADNHSVYISNGNGYGDNYVYKIDIPSLSKTDSVDVGKGPEKMIKLNNHVYVVNSGGYTNNDSTVMAINIGTFEVDDTIKVNKVPVDLVSDKNKNLWVYCKGVPDYTNWPNVTYAGAGLVKINPSNHATTVLPFGSITCQGINNIAIDASGDNLYFITDGLYKMAVSATSLPTAKFYDKAFYGVDVDPKSGDVVGLDEINSKAIVIDSNGEELYDFDTNPYPNAVTFQW